MQEWRKTGFKQDNLALSTELINPKLKIYWAGVRKWMQSVTQS